MVANYIHIQAFYYYKGCVLSFYGNINEDIIPVMSNSLCASFNTKDECLKNQNYERFYINLIILLAFIKAVSIIVFKDLTGYEYIVQYKHVQKVHH